MPRTDKKATKIAFNILGTPGNMRKRKPKKIKNDFVVKTNIDNKEPSRIINNNIS